MILHIGCGKRKHEGFVNTDKEEMDISKPWPYEDESVDGIISMQVFQQLTWRELIIALKESYRVLKKGGVMRFGTVLLDSGRPLDFLLGWKNIILFNYSILRDVLVDHIGYNSIRLCGYQDTSIPEFKKVDNRRDRGSSYVEVVK
jgi:ubiquinone/menaquinone biosynthesis C-methylase UbiE